MMRRQAQVERVKAAHTPVVTTSYILAECANAAARTDFRLEVGGGLIFPTADDWRSAWDGYRQDQAGAAGLVDHLSFVVPARHKAVGLSLDVLQVEEPSHHFQVTPIMFVPEPPPMSCASGKTVSPRNCDDDVSGLLSTRFRWRVFCGGSLRQHPWRSEL